MGPITPPHSSGSPPPPSVPARATIESYDIVDAVGVLRLEEGDLVRFGRSACKDFEPLVGVSVVLAAVSSSPFVGWRAKSITVDPQDERYDELLAARDRSMGLRSRRPGLAEVVASARRFSALTILMKEPLPDGQVALRRWASDRRISLEGVVLTTDPDLEFELPSGSGSLLTTYPGRCPFPKDGLDTRRLPEDFDFGRSFIGLDPGLPFVDRRERRAARGLVAHEFEVLLRLVRVLISHATGIVIHPAGNHVVPAAEVVSQLRGLDDGEVKRFASWLGVSLVDSDGVAFWRFGETIESGVALVPVAPPPWLTPPD